MSLLFTNSMLLLLVMAENKNTVNTETMGSGIKTPKQGYKPKKKTKKKH